MDRENKSDYIIRHVYGANRVVARLGKMVGMQYRWEDENGRIHFSRVPRAEPKPIPPVVDPSLPPGQPLPTPTDPTKVYGRVMHDYELIGMSRPERLEAELGYPLLNSAGELVQGLPETQKAMDSRAVPLDINYQTYWFHLLWKANPSLSRAEAVNLFRKVTRGNAFKTNNMAPPGPYANFITGENLDCEPMKTEIILTGGALVEILDFPMTVRVGGHDCYKVKMLDTHFAPPALEYFDGMHQTATVYFATTSQRTKLPDGTRRVIPLTGGGNIAVPSVARAGYALFDVTVIRLLTPGADSPNPYNY